MKLSGNIIFITGGTSGIGRALAEELHKLNNQVIISGRRKALLDEVTAANPGMKAVELDMENPESIKAVSAKLIADFPGLNVLINHENTKHTKPNEDSFRDFVLSWQLSALLTAHGPPWD